MFLHRAYFFSTYGKNMKKIKEIFLFICIPFEREEKKKKKKANLMFLSCISAHLLQYHRRSSSLQLSPIAHPSTHSHL